MKVSSILIFFLITSTIFSQEKSFQAEVGLNRSWFNYEFDKVNEIKTELHPQITAGLLYNFTTFNNFSVKAGIRYFNLSRYVDMEPYGFSSGSLTTFDNYLISIPLQISYNIEIINTYILLNAEPSYILNSKIKLPSLSAPFSSETDVTTELNRIQFAMGIGLEYVFNIAQQKFGVKSIYNYGLTNFPKEGEFTNSTGTHSWEKFNASELNLLLTYYF